MQQYFPAPYGPSSKFRSEDSGSHVLKLLEKPKLRPRNSISKTSPSNIVRREYIGEGSTSHTAPPHENETASPKFKAHRSFLPECCVSIAHSRR